MVRIHNLETGEIIDREMNKEEENAYLANAEKMRLEKVALEEKTQARASALAKLSALGLTEEEIAAL